MEGEIVFQWIKDLAHEKSGDNSWLLAPVPAWEGGTRERRSVAAPVFGGPTCTLTQPARGTELSIQRCQCRRPFLEFSISQPLVIANFIPTLIHGIFSRTFHIESFLLLLSLPTHSLCWLPFSTILVIHFSLRIRSLHTHPLVRLFGTLAKSTCLTVTTIAFLEPRTRLLVIR